MVQEPLTSAEKDREREEGGREGQRARERQRAGVAEEFTVAPGPVLSCHT